MGQLGMWSDTWPSVQTEPVTISKGLHSLYKALVNDTPAPGEQLCDCQSLCSQFISTELLALTTGILFVHPVNQS